VSCTDILRLDRTIRRLLRGNPSEVEEGFHLLARRYQKRIEHWTAKHFPSLASQAEDIWQETTVAIWTIARAGELRQGGSLRPLLTKIANRRAAERLRSRRRPEELKDPAHVVDTRVQSDRLTCEETMRIIAREVQRWTKKRREVWMVYLKYFPVLASYEDLRQAVFSQTGVLLSTKTVIRRVQVGRQKIRKLLSRLH
jgi:DNA-directed RNA polymerase specialized sigma24 family protein